MFVRSLCLSTAAAWLLAVPVYAQLPAFTSGFQRGGAPAPPPSPNNTGPSRSNFPTGMENQQQPSDPLASDRKFVKQVSEDGMAHIALGRLAQEKGSSPEVKEYGKRMAEDHAKVNEELRQAAAKASIESASEASRKNKKAQEKLAKLSGAEFDRAYIKMTVNDHRSEVKEFEREAHKGNAPEVKQYAAKSLAMHQEHLKQAEALEGGHH